MKTVLKKSPTEISTSTKSRRVRSRIQLGEVGMSPRTRILLENNKQAVEEAEKSLTRQNPLFNR